MRTQDIFERAYGGVIGIDDELNIFGGYDQKFDPAGATAECPEWIEPDDWDTMPKDEKRSLADRMIALWQRYKDAAV